MKREIRFFTEGVDYLIREKGKIRLWVEGAVEKEGYVPGELNFIICTDKYLQKINRKYLNNRLLTDVIAFNFSEREHEVCGEIYISLERVRENAKKYKQTIKMELKRVMIHGVLHLMGYNDHNENEIGIMREKEAYYLAGYSK